MCTLLPKFLQWLLYLQRFREEGEAEVEGGGLCKKKKKEEVDKHE